MKSREQVTLQVGDELGFELREYLPSISLCRSDGPRQGQALAVTRETTSQLRPCRPLMPAPPPRVGALLVPTKCLQAAKEPTHSQRLVKNIIFLSINLEADSELLGCGDWRTIFSEETIFPWIKGTCL